MDTDNRSPRRDEPAEPAGRTTDDTHDRIARRLLAKELSGGRYTTDKDHARANRLVRPLEDSEE